ncbi:beta strand repeat-containing protein [Mesorhizobium sp. ArgA1]
MRLLFRLLLLAATLAAAPAWAQDWGAVVNVSTTMGITGNRLCYGEASRGDIGCPSNAPVVSGSTITGTFVGDGSGLTGLTVTTDRIVSGTSSAVIDPTGALTVAGRLEIVTGTNVVAIGNNAGLTNSGTNVVAVGTNAGMTNTGSAVTLVGKSAGYGNAGSNVVGVGDFAAQYNSGTALTAVGHAAAQTNTGNNVTAVGGWAGTSNTADNLTALGGSAGMINTGSAATFVGKSAGYGNAGPNVVGVGDFAAQYNSGTALTAVGHAAAQTNTGNNVTAVGGWAGTSNTYSNVTLLGYAVYTADKSNQVVLGNANVVEVSTAGVYVGKGVSTTGGISGTSGYFSSNVGIGTATPSTSLNIMGSSPIIRLSDITGLYSSVNGSSGNLYYSSYNSARNHYFMAGGTELMRILGTGQVGIGTATPTTALEVSGTVSATNFVGNGSGLTGVSTVTDRLVSGTSVATLSPNGNLSVRGLLDIVTGTNVVVVGSNAGLSSSGTGVTALGASAARLNNGGNVTALGYGAGYQNTGGTASLMGTYAGYSNAGANTAAAGAYAAQNNSGTNVTAMGTYAAQNNTGNSITAAGYLAGQTNTGLYLSALGYAAGQINTGDYSTLVGGFAGQNNTQTHLTGVGYFAGKDNTSAYVTAVGEEAGQLNSGYALVAMGVATGKYNTGSNSTVIGSYAGQYNTGLNTAALGYLAARNNLASNVTALGAYAVQNASVSNTYSNVTGVGFNAQPNKSNQVVLGDGNVVEVSTAGVYVGKGVSATNVSASYIDATRNGTVSATTGYFANISATHFYGDGSGLTGVIAAGSDRIASGTAQVIANGTTNSISITESGVTTGYFYNGIWVAGGVSTTGTVSGSRAYFSTNVGVGTTNPATSLEVSGTVSATILQLADGPPATCGPGAYGTMKMVNGRPYYCRP